MTQKNIFKDAKFGDKFKTRDGRMAIYLTDKDEKRNIMFAIQTVTKDDCLLLKTTSRGKTIYEYEENPIPEKDVCYDIVSKWEEEK